MFRKQMPNRFKVTDKPLLYNESLCGEIKEENGIIDIVLGAFYPQSNLEKICELLNSMEKDYQTQAMIIHSYHNLHEVAKMIQQIKL